ncbi:MAG: 30S ribosomal protein S18 [uncultured bacterium]|nr:MAG: 30S ribosomal protein S18 [uncultured bacterium]
MPQYFRQRNCYFCRKKIEYIDFRNTQSLNRFLSPWSKIRAAKDTGNCAKHQRILTQAIKRARFMAMLPYLTR